MSIHLNSAVSRRRFLGGAAVLSLSPALPGFSAEAKSETWAFLADTHIDKNPAYVARGTNIADNLKQVVAEVLAEKDNLTGILIDGDCAFNVGLRADYDQLAEIIKPLIDTKLPIHMTMGNHDDRGPFYEAFSEMKAQNPALESKHVGLVESKFANFVFLDSLRFVNKVEGEFGEEQLKWLAEVLDVNPGKPTILIGHHYPQVFRDDVIPSAKPYKLSGLIDSEPFLELIEKRPQAKAYVHGHSHTWGIKSDEAGFHQINLPPTSYVFDEKQPNGWVKATISADGILTELRAIDTNHSAHGVKRELPWR
ncbi:MAG: metallophosphoesterase family protein [Verrucomicrobiales bacterium]